jgi:GNAT superfamily N-acetyltransferase
VFREVLTKMTLPITIKSLQVNDVDHLKGIIEQGVNKKTYLYTIYSCHGYLEYVKRLLCVPKNNQDIFFIGAYTGRDLVSVAEWRIIDKSFFLNRIFVREDFRRQGIGEQLFEYGKQMAITKHADIISLHVFEDNLPAITWYKRMGFLEKSQLFWLVGTNHGSPNDGMSGNYQIEDYELAEQNHKDYGFSSFKILIGNAKYNVGRLGDYYFRLTNINALLDNQLLSVLKHLDARRLLLAIVPSDPCVNGLDLITKSIQLDLSLR